MDDQKDELKDIVVGLEQRITAYESKLKDLKKKRERLNEEIATIEKYLELAKTLYRVEADKAKLGSLSSQILEFAFIRSNPLLQANDNILQFVFLIVHKLILNISFLLLSFINNCVN